MMCRILALSLLALIAGAPGGLAADRTAGTVVKKTGALVPSGEYYRRRTARPPRIVGRRPGFYSYSYDDVINTYGLSRSLYGSINSYRDPSVDRQTPVGPFDHGFFFDSAKRGPWN
jgi:hypothetical protein